MIISFLFIILHDAVGLTIEEKLNRLCPQFARWDHLYGDKQNINPFHIADASSEEEDEDNEEEEENVRTSLLLMSLLWDNRLSAKKKLNQAKKTHSNHESNAGCRKLSLLCANHLHLH